MTVHKQSYFSFLLYISKSKPQIPLKSIIFLLVFTMYLVHVLHRKLPLSPQPIIWRVFFTNEWKPNLFLGGLSPNLVFRVIKRLTLGSDSLRGVHLFLLLYGCFHRSPHGHWVLCLCLEEVNLCTYVHICMYVSLSLSLSICSLSICLFPAPAVLPQPHLPGIELDPHMCENHAGWGNTTLRPGSPGGCSRDWGTQTLRRNFPMNRSYKLRKSCDTALEGFVLPRFKFNKEYEWQNGGRPTFSARREMWKCLSTRWKAPRIS